MTDLPAFKTRLVRGDGMIVLRSYAFGTGVLSTLFLFSTSGCHKPDEIVSYTVAKPPARERKTESPDEQVGSFAGRQSIEPEVEGQILGAILTRGKTTWFFKILGPSPAVETQTGSFVQFVKSIRFSSGRPEWTLPEGWKEEPGSQMRFATLRIATDEGPVELTVIPLPTGQGSIDDYVLSNVNRWRDQLKLAPLPENELNANVVKLDVDGESAWVVNFVGQLSGQPMAPGKSIRFSGDR